MRTGEAAVSTRVPAALWRALALLVLSVAINYIDRGNLSIAAPLLQGEIGLSASQLGYLLSSFFWTYAAFQIVSGWLVDRFDMNRVIAAGFFLWPIAAAAVAEGAPTITEILGRREAWATFAGHFCANHFWYFLLTWLPFYLVRDHFNLDRSRFRASVRRRSRAPLGGHAVHTTGASRRVARM